MRTLTTLRTLHPGQGAAQICLHHGLKSRKSQTAPQQQAVHSQPQYTPPHCRHQLCTVPLKPLNLFSVFATDWAANPAWWCCSLSLPSRLHTFTRLCRALLQAVQVVQVLCTRGVRNSLVQPESCRPCIVHLVLGLLPATPTGFSTPASRLPVARLPMPARVTRRCLLLLWLDTH